MSYITLKFITNSINLKSDKTKLFLFSSERFVKLNVTAKKKNSIIQFWRWLSLHQNINTTSRFVQSTYSLTVTLSWMTQNHACLQYVTRRISSIWLGFNCIYQCIYLCVCVCVCGCVWYRAVLNRISLCYYVNYKRAIYYILSDAVFSLYWLTFNGMLRNGMLLETSSYCQR